MEFIKSRKGKAKIVYEGFMYTKHSQRSNKIRWSCVRKWSQKCKGALYTDLQCLHPHQRVAHNHPADNASCVIAKSKDTLANQASVMRQFATVKAIQKNSNFAQNRFKFDIIRHESQKSSLQKKQNEIYSKKSNTSQEKYFHGRFLI